MFRSARVQFPVHVEICKRAVEAKKKRGVNGEPQRVEIRNMTDKSNYFTKALVRGWPVGAPNLSR